MVRNKPTNPSSQRQGHWQARKSLQQFARSSSFFWTSGNSICTYKVIGSVTLPPIRHTPTAVERRAPSAWQLINDTNAVKSPFTRSRHISIHTVFQTGSVAAAGSRCAGVKFVRSFLCLLIFLKSYTDKPSSLDDTYISFPPIHSSCWLFPSRSWPAHHKTTWIVPSLTRQF